MSVVQAITIPLNTYERDAEEKRLLAAAVRDAESLLLHLRTCNACYDGEGCLDCHLTVKRMVVETETARVIARRMAPAASPEPVR